MKSIKFIFIFLLLFISLSFISAEPPFTEQTGGTLDIEFSKIDIFKQNTDHHFHFHLYNETKFISNSTGQCGLTINQPNGSVLYKNQNIPYHAGSENEWGVTINGGNFSEIGQYSFVVECNTSKEVGLTSVGFSVSPTGFAGTLGFYILIFTLSLGIIVLGYYSQDSVIVLLGSFGLVFIALFLLFYGLDGIKDSIYTEGLAIIMIGLSAYLMFRSSSDFLN